MLKSDNELDTSAESDFVRAAYPGCFSHPNSPSDGYTIWDSHGKSIIAIGDTLADAWHNAAKAAFLLPVGKAILDEPPQKTNFPLALWVLLAGFALFGLVETGHYLIRLALGNPAAFVWILGTSFIVMMALIQGRKERTNRGEK